MTKQNQTRPCAACGQPDRGVISETFADNSSAFRRHAELVRVGQAPSLCIKRDGTCNVCRLGQSSAR